MKFSKYIVAIIFILGFTACDDYLDIEPKDKVIPTTVEDFQQLLISGYDSFPITKSKTELRTDILDFDATDYSATDYKDIYLWNDLNYDESTSEFGYDLLYRVIFYANEVIHSGGEKLESSDEKDQLMAEAHALRAYAFFELVNLFSDVYQEGESQKGVPLVTNIDLEQEFKLATLDEVYNLIHSDLDKAEALVKVKEFSGSELYHFSELAIKALQSRVYLYQGNWEKSLDYVDQVLSAKNTLLDLNNNPEELLPNHLKSVEQILALDYAVHDKVSQVSFANEFLMSKYDDEDLRKTLFYDKDDDKFRPKKGNKKELTNSFRTGELFLVKAELLTRLGNLNESKEALNTLVKNRKTKAGAEAYALKIQNLNQDELLNEIFEERIRELAFEGYRWFDLRRYNQKEIMHKAGALSAVLKEKDPRYTIAFPRSARTENPYLD